ncbi:MAG: 4-hydroxy-tetrahydrodipicolinate reductase [Clostridiales bacterium]|nr:4-hydroxy-tetrahydrodipicolinate reductase [Clostridiales bacterium]
MIKVIISGCNGRMGQAVSDICEEKENLKIVAGFDTKAEKLRDYPVYADPMEFSGEADVIIDFSNPNSLENLLAYCTALKTSCILCTTGYSGEQLSHIERASESIPIFKSGNMSLGINLLMSLAKKAASVLGVDFDVEIVERHHKNKIDSPSGTALMLADALSTSLPYEPEYVYERQSVRQKRGAKEIGISAVRGGSIVGEHEVIFAGNDEVIELKHSAYSRNVFASGAVAAAEYMSQITAAGLYDMDDMLSATLDC